MNFNGAKEFILLKLSNELSDKLYYHGKHHTLDVLRITEELCREEQIDEYHTILLKTAALLHDIGFVQSNAEHEKIGCEISQEILPQFGYTPGEIRVISGMIMATKVPQSPQTKYEEILCDADLDYLGRDDFYSIGKTLFKELHAFNILDDEKKWNVIQISFLEKHNYFTTTNKKRREPQKQIYIQKLKDLVATY